MNIKPYVLTKTGRKIIVSFLEQFMVFVGIYATIWSILVSIFPNISAYYTYLLLLCLFLILLGMFFFRKNTIHLFYLDDDGKAKIKKYMIDWMSQGYRILISSRNLSWVDAEVIEMLNEKNEDIEICVITENEITKQLRSKSIKVHKYADESEFIPESRLTIIGFGKAGRVAACKILDEYHVIEEFNSDTISHDIAQDFGKLMLLMSKKNEQDKDGKIKR